MPFVFAVAPHHPLAFSTKARSTTPCCCTPRRGRGRFGAAPVAAHGQPAAGAGGADGQHHADKIEALLRGLGCGFVPLHLVRSLVDGGQVGKPTQRHPGAGAGLRLALPGRPKGPAGRRRAWPAVVAAAAGQRHHPQGLLDGSH
jgi:DNA-binding transcriptional LysR family regulator